MDGRGIVEEQDVNCRASNQKGGILYPLSARREVPEIDSQAGRVACEAPEHAVCPHGYSTGKVLRVGERMCDSKGVRPPLCSTGLGYFNAQRSDGMAVGMNSATIQQRKNMSTRSTIAIALTALAAGAALGVLLAPASGAETRKKLARKTSDLKDRLAEMIEEGSDLIDELKGEAGDLADKAKSTANSAKEKVKDSANEMAAHARSAAHSGN